MVGHAPSRHGVPTLHSHGNPSPGARRGCCPRLVGREVRGGLPTTLQDVRSSEKEEEEQEQQEEEAEEAEQEEEETEEGPRGTGGGEEERKGRSAPRSSSAK